MDLKLLLLRQEVDGLGQNVVRFLEQQTAQHLRSQVVQVLNDSGHRQDVKQEQRDLEKGRKNHYFEAGTNLLGKQSWDLWLQSSGLFLMLTSPLGCTFYGLLG